MIKGKTAIVTGASRSIGKAIALKLAHHGANVVVNYLKSESAAKFVANEINDTKVGSAMVYQADVSDKSAVDSMILATLDQFGHIDILINNAGQILHPQYWRDVTAETWEKNSRINLLGVLFCSQAAIPHMEKQGEGKIVNIASTYGITGSPFVPAYTAGKAAVINLTLGLAKDLAPSITVNAIAPGNIDTELTTSAGEEFVQGVINNTPMKRLGRPEEIADAAYFLSSPMSSFITGHVLVVDGGFIL